MRLRIFVAQIMILALVVATGCDTLEVEADRPTPANNDSAKGDNKTVTCDEATDCQSCLDVDGCNWTGGQCADTCLQDVDCFGPGNAAASSCPVEPPACADITDEQQCVDREDCIRDVKDPCLEMCVSDSTIGCCEYIGCKDKQAPPPPPQACADITDEQQCFDRQDCQRKQGFCLAYCIPEEVGCCEFLGCELRSCNSLTETDCKAREDCEWHTSPGFPGPISTCDDKEEPTPTDCSAMDVAVSGDCDAFLGYHWNGYACHGVSGCSCQGADCGKFFKEKALCEAAYASCIDCTGASIDVYECIAPNDAILPDICCATERKSKCDAINDQYKQAVEDAKSCSPFVTAPQCTEYVNEELECPICGTYINAFNDMTSLNSIAGEWKAMRCPTVSNSCPPIVCDPASGGVCDVNSSTCSDIFP